MTYVHAALALIAGHLIGAVPFAFLLVWWRKGIDIRTVGSGNVGATNAARVLGVRWFLPIFLLDGLKGFLPTWALPRLVAAATGTPAPDLPVLVALATILGHNYPVYLGFRGGKGVATSLGAMFALDWASSLAAVGAFAFLLTLSRYVSLSSIGGGLTFAAVHFARTSDPWGRSERTMSLVVGLLVVMLIVRHRSNLVRIAAGSEPMLQSRRARGEPAGTDKGGDRHGGIGDDAKP